MRIEIRCADLGFDCGHILSGRTEEEVLDAAMQHIDVFHEGDWFDHEVVYDAARGSMRKIVA
jgi:predicted small metal-binding protein